MKKTTGISALITIAFFVFAPLAVADDADDVMATIQRWADLEGDLQAQAALIRDDRVMVAGGIRQSNQAENMRNQIAVVDARQALSGGSAQFLVSILSPEIAVYGNTAVASFVRLMRVIPHNADPLPQGTAWFSMVLVKEGRDWRIAHTHVSPAGN